jgi:hypothetical protein
MFEMQRQGLRKADVRLMNDSQSYEAAASIGARAFTVGQRIF